jgi:hypothetical protein
MEFNLASYLFLGAVPIILGLVQVIKAWIADAKWYPVISIFLGLIINMGLASVTGIGYVSAFVMGIIAGLSSSGLYLLLQINRKKVGNNSPP